MDAIELKGELIIDSIVTDKTKPVQITRKRHTDELPLCLIGFLTFDEGKFDFLASENRQVLNIENFRLIESLKDHFSFLSNKISSFQIDNLRDSAIALEGVDLKKSYYLMLLAHEANPKERLIKIKLDEYEKKCGI